MQTQTQPSPETLRAFLTTHYKHERLEGRGEDYVEAVVQGRLRDLAARGIDGISKHESRTGAAIWFDADLNVIAYPRRIPA